MKKKVFISLSLFLVSGCHPSTGGKCIASESSPGRLLRNETVYLLTYLAGSTQVWVEACDATFLIANHSEEALKAVKMSMGTSPDGAAFQGKLDGQIIFSPQLKSLVVRIDKIRNLRQLDAVGKDRVHDVIISSARERQ